MSLSSLGLGLKLLQLRVQENSCEGNPGTWTNQIFPIQFVRESGMIDLIRVVKGKRCGPRELTGETGVLKNRTEVTMTTTRLTQLPTEWVTGDTLARIMYDTFNKLSTTRSVSKLKIVNAQHHVYTGTGICTCISNNLTRHQTCN